MLLLKRLEVDGFGPFASRQEIEFATEPGVTVVYGENMRGKTSLLNAIRYAFFGVAYQRGARPRRLGTLVNRDNAAEGRHEFSVSLKFDHDGHAYELVRECTSTVSEPRSDADYHQEVLLRRGSAALGPQEREHALKVVFPAEISRFFLFDGELLQEYEELLINESEAGKKISEAIERILGVPVLKRARAHLTMLSERAEGQAAREASRHQATQAVGNALQNATTLREEHRREMARKQQDLQSLTDQRVNIEEMLKSQQRYSSILEERDATSARLEEIRLELRQRSVELQKAMSGAWRSVLGQTVREARVAAQAELQVEFDQRLIFLRRQAIQSSHCAVCDQTLSRDLVIRLQTTVAHAELPDDIGSISPAMVKLADLAKFQELDNSGEIRQLARRLNELQHDQVVARERLDDLNARLVDADQESIRQSHASFAEILARIAIVKQGIDSEAGEIERYDQNIQRLRKTLEASSTPDLVATQVRASTLRESAEVFGAAIERYKSDLRSRVEATASTLFREMTTEKQDYASLSINESYGLTIVHRDGRSEVARSAGAEHVVALALMGALQRNSPLRGPIVMDSPFGRLDDNHTSNVVKALPSMADQVVLLVYEAEVGRDRMRELLGDSLRREYELSRISARRTQIVPVA
jgi:DNA sulfur modification protein DndD